MQIDADEDGAPFFPAAISAAGAPSTDANDEAATDEPSEIAASDGNQTLEGGEIDGETLAASEEPSDTQAAVTHGAEVDA